MRPGRKKTGEAVETAVMAVAARTGAGNTAEFGGRRNLPPFFLGNEAPMNTNAPPLIKREGINRVSLTAFGIVHIGAITAFFFFSWPAFFTALFLYWITLSLGNGMGYHRLLTH